MDKSSRPMPLRCSVYVATSVDGFIARPDGDIDWLHDPVYAEAPLQGLTYEAFTATVDVLVMGRHTFETVCAFETWPYEGQDVLVLTSNEGVVPPHLKETVRTASGSPAEIVAMLEAEGKQHAYIDGGLTIQRFLRAGLIDDITITRIPILLGQGIPLFGALDADVHLRLVESTPSDNGFVQVRYTTGRSAPA